MTSYLIAAGSVILLMVSWVLVQNAWKKSFPEHTVDDDALAGRNDCGSCGCGATCSKKQLNDKAI
jgi:hypothetical protein